MGHNEKKAFWPLMTKKKVQSRESESSIFGSEKGADITHPTKDAGNNGEVVTEVRSQVSASS